MSKKKLGPQTLLYPMPAVLVGAVVEGKANFMTAAWCSIACLKPPAISVAVNTARHTLKGIKQNGAFSINVPSADLVKDVDYCGIYSGAKRDKSSIFKVYLGELQTVPLIEECPVNLECKLIQSLDIGSHTLIVGEILETHVTESCLTDGKPDPVKINPLVFSPAVQQYHRLGPVIAQAFKVGKDR
ncbi:MAG: flavin reductase family protein [Desulfatiglandales bacterium]